MITDAHATTLKELGAGFVSALKSAQIRKLIGMGELQLSLFDRETWPRSPRGVPRQSASWCAATRTSPPSERANARTCCKQPSASSRRSSTWSQGRAARSATPTAGKIGERAGRVSTSTRSPSTSTSRSPTARSPTSARPSRSTARPRSTGSTCSEPPAATSMLTTQAVVRVYKQLKIAERAYRTIKDALDVAPDPPPPRGPRPRALLPVPARLLPAVRAPSPPRADAVHRRHPTHPSRPRRARPTLPRRQHQSRPRPHPRRPARLQPHRPDRRTRHRLPQPATHRRQPPTPSRGSPTPTPSRPKRSNYSTSNSPRSQSQTSPQHPNPAPTRGIRHLNTENFRLDAGTVLGLTVASGVDEDQGSRSGVARLLVASENFGAGSLMPPFESLSHRGSAAPGAGRSSAVRGRSAKSDHQSCLPLRFHDPRVGWSGTIARSSGVAGELARQGAESGLRLTPSGCRSRVAPEPTPGGHAATCQSAAPRNRGGGSRSAHR